MHCWKSTLTWWSYYLCVFLMIYSRKQWCLHHWFWAQVSVWDPLCSGFKQGFSLRCDPWHSVSGVWLCDQRPERSLLQKVRTSLHNHSFLFFFVLMYFSSSLCHLVCFFFFSFQLVQVREWGGSVLQTHILCFPGLAGQLPKGNWTGRELQFPAAGWTGHLPQGNHL